MVKKANEERQRELISLYNRSPIKHTLAVTLSYSATGTARFHLPYNPAFDNASGGIHGGIVATLMDKAGWFAAAQHYDTWIATADLQLHILEAVERQHLCAEGRVLRAGRRLAVCAMEVRTAADALVASGSGSFMVTSRPFSLDGL